MSSRQNWIFIQSSIFIHRRMSQSCSHPCQEMNICVPSVTVQRSENHTVCSEFLFYPKRAVCRCVDLSERVCAAPRRCFMTLHTSRSRFTFYTHILSAWQRLSVSLFALSVCSHWPLLYRGCAVLISSPVFIPLCGLLSFKTVCLFFYWLTLLLI